MFRTQTRPSGAGLVEEPNHTAESQRWTRFLSSRCLATGRGKPRVRGASCGPSGHILLQQKGMYSMQHGTAVPVLQTQHVKIAEIAEQQSRHQAIANATYTTAPRARTLNSPPQGEVPHLLSFLLFPPSFPLSQSHFPDFSRSSLKIGSKSSRLRW